MAAAAAHTRGQGKRTCRGEGRSRRAGDWHEGLHTVVSTRVPRVPDFNRQPAPYAVSVPDITAYARTVADYA
eukprot:122142-Rhodomonas_salina.2